VTSGRSASHHLQVKAALSLLCEVLSSPNPFHECLAPKFASEKTLLRYHTASQLGQLLRELRADKESYFGHLTYRLASALFFTGCRFHQWALLTVDRLIREPAARSLRCACSSKTAPFAICRSFPSSPTRLRSGLLSWRASKGSGCGLGQWTSRDLSWCFQAETARPLAIRHSTPVSSSPVSALGCQSFPPTRYGIRPRSSCSTSAEPTCATCRRSWDTRARQQRRVILSSIPSTLVGNRRLHS
jgi:hypothetical protein